jgi:hypothetical protein
MATVPTIATNVAGSSLLAPPMPLATSGAEKVAAVEAATMPRIHGRDEDPLVPGQAAACGGHRRDGRAHYQNQDGNQGVLRPQPGHVLPEPRPRPPQPICLGGLIFDRHYGLVFERRRHHVLERTVALSKLADSSA